MNIEEYNFKDRLLKGITTDGHFKISVVKTTEVVKTAKENHQLSLLNTVVLGKALTATMLLASELKGEERIQLRMDGDGPIGFIIAEANSVGEIRGYVQNPAAELDYSNPETELGDGIGLGILTFSKVLYNEAEPKTSTIELVKGDVNADVAHYLAQSEQIPSAILVDVGIDEEGNVTQAGGLLIQRMPGAPDGQIDMLQERLGSFPPIDELLNDGQYIDEIMGKAVSPLQVKELNRQPVDFFCRCSRKRFLNALSMLNYEDLKEMDGEGQEMVCQYCNNKEFISKDEIEKIVMDAQAKMN
ncbi:MAG: Hsp33 family molecular chaperone HslO [Balneola sp.]|jgi:molecular chaperone Hsp33|nr:Hsp33 family molecular chaperone HslO [Balneola sp.]MBE78014.1 Hsp33 family molecular chaperone HslO [Balneola sp.]|tara:strand:- start:473 stop:1375 length:903 start_codon:yes stop_codon:yes gene_type:complete